MGIFGDPAGTGPLTKPLDLAAAMVAGSAAMQDRAGLTGDPAAASKIAKHIHFPFLDAARLREFFPVAVIGFGDEHEWQVMAAGAQNYLRTSSASFRVMLADVARAPKGGPADDSYEMPLRDFSNWVGAVILDLLAIAGEGEQLNITGISEEIMPSPCPEEEELAGGLYFLASYLIRWS